MDVRERCGRTISYFQYEFEEGVEQLKKINNALDLEVLQRADVIGMTTTGWLPPSFWARNVLPMRTLVHKYTLYLPFLDGYVVRRAV